MQTNELINYISPVLFSLLVWYIQRRQTQRDKTLDARLQQERAARELAAAKLEAETERRAESRRQESIKVLKLLHNVGVLALCCARAIRDGRSNGELARSIEAVQICLIDLDDFMREEATEGYAYKGGADS